MKKHVTIQRCIRILRRPFAAVRHKLNCNRDDVPGLIAVVVAVVGFFAAYGADLATVGARRGKLVLVVWAGAGDHNGRLDSPGLPSMESCDHTWSGGGGLARFYSGTW